MSELNFYSINAGPFRSTFYLIQSLNILFCIGTFLLIKSGSWILSTAFIGKSFTSITVLIMVLLATIFTGYNNKKLKNILNINEFDIKVSKYYSFYKIRLLWFLFSCIVAGLLGILSGRMLFFYFTIIDLLFAMPYYPTLFLFRKELKNGEIVLT